MFLIGTALYTALTIIIIPILLVLIYIMVVNNRYKDIINVYNIETSSVIGWISLIAAIYLFLTGFCIGDIPHIWKSTIFLICFFASIFISIIICKILNFVNKERIKYANILLADKQICEKLETGTNQMAELKKIASKTSFTFEQKEVNKLRLKELQDTLNKLMDIHQELQQQKILMNACLSTSEMKNVTLKDNKTVNKTLDREKDKFEANRMINDDYRSVRNLMKKYNI